MEQGFGSCGSGPSGQNVIRPDESGEHAMAGYDATSGGPVAGWEKVDDVAGQVGGSDMVGHDHFSGVASGSKPGTSAGPWKQT